jgi:DNA primase
VGNEVEEIKKKLDIVDQINRVLPLKKRGRHYVACCPFHSEKTPSFTVSPEMQIFKCFGCGKAGDIFTFFQEFHRLDFRETLEELAKIAGVKLTDKYVGTQEEMIRKKMILINQEVAKFYHYILNSHPLGVDSKKYLTDREIKQTTIDEFKIGFAPADSRLIISYLKKKGFSDEELIKSGTFGWSQYGIKKLYDRFSGRLTFPLIDFRNRIIGFSGRVLPGAKKELAKYINSPETELYHKSQTVFGINLAKEAIREKKSVIVVEGEFDMISPYQVGIKNIIAIKGTAFTLDQLQLLRRYTDTLILALDTDFAGNKAAIKSIEMAEEMDFEIKVVEMEKEYKDPDEAVRDNPEKFKKMVEEAVSIWDFIIDSSVKNNDIDTIRGKKEVLSLCLPFIARIKNEVIRSDFIHKLASQIGSETEAVKTEMSRIMIRTETAKDKIENPETKVETNRVEAREERIMILALASNKIEDVFKFVLENYQFKTDKFNKIIKLVVSGRIDFKKPLENVPEELRDIFSSIYLLSQKEKGEPRQRKDEIEKITSELRIEELKTEIKNLSDLISKCEKSGDEEKMKILENDYKIALGQLSKWQKHGKW